MQLRMWDGYVDRTARRRKAVHLVGLGIFGWTAVLLIAGML